MAEALMGGSAAHPLPAMCDSQQKSALKHGNAPGLTPSASCRHFTPGGEATFMWQEASTGDLPFAES